MSTVQEIQKALFKLSSDELALFRSRFEEDARSGKLDKIAEGPLPNTGREMPKKYEACCQRFLWERYERLPDAVHKQADRSFALLKTDSRHPSLHLKKVGK